MAFILGQKIIDKLRHKKRIQDIELSSKLPKTTRNISDNFQIISTSGFYFSGSGALIDLFFECDLGKIIGGTEVYSLKDKKTNKNNNEIKFFTDEKSIFNLISSFLNETELEQDLAIKQFIYTFYNFYDENVCKDLYSDEWLNITVSFLESILEVDDKTKQIMSGKRYPSWFEANDDVFDNCSFMYGDGYKRYIYYKFKKLSKKDFHQLVCDYFYDFFMCISKEGYIICDQLTSSTLLLDKMNFYMNEHPIKEICVWRDPRDQYMSAFRASVHLWLSRDVKKYISFYKNVCIRKLNNKSVNRLNIRFEDLVLKYDETINKIFKFIKLPPQKHINPKTIFDPNISKMNIGAYKDFLDQDFMKVVEKELKNYCNSGE